MQYLSFAEHTITQTITNQEQCKDPNTPVLYERIMGKKVEQLEETRHKDMENLRKRT